MSIVIEHDANICLPHHSKRTVGKSHKHGFASALGHKQYCPKLGDTGGWVQNISHIGLTPRLNFWVLHDLPALGMELECSAKCKPPASQPTLSASSGDYTHPQSSCKYNNVLRIVYKRIPTKEAQDLRGGGESKSHYSRGSPPAFSRMSSSLTS